MDLPAERFSVMDNRSSFTVSGAAFVIFSVTWFRDPLAGSSQEQSPCFRGILLARQVVFCNGYAGAALLFPGRPVCDFLCHTVSGAKCLPFAVKVFCNGYAGAVILFPGRPVCDFLCDTVSGAKCLPFAVKVFCNGYAGAVLLFPGRPVCDFLCHTVSGAKPG